MKTFYDRAGAERCWAGAVWIKRMSRGMRENHDIA